MTSGLRPDTRRRLDASVRGVVQGVGFRWFVVREATALGLEGWVANAPDGSVRVVAEGLPADLDALAAALRRGPAASWVSGVEERRGPPQGGLGPFRIRSGSHPGD